MHYVSAHKPVRISCRAKDVLTNALLFQVCWLTAILNMGPLMFIPFFTILAHYFQTSRDCLQDVKVFTAVFLIGVFADTLFLHLGIFYFPGYEAPEVVGSLKFLEFVDTVKGNFAPDWLILLWAAFATTVTRSLLWVFSRSNVAYLVMVMGGPFAYMAGRACGAIEFSSSDLGVMMLFWFMFTFVCRKLVGSEA